MIYFILSILSYWLQDLSNKKFCISVGRTSVGVTLIQNAICCLSASATLMLFTRISINSLQTVLLAALFGITYLGTVFLLLCAFMHGTVGLSTLMCNIGMFIAAFYGIVRFGEQFTVTIAAGYVCMLLAVILSTPRRGSGERGGIKWFMFALGSGICNGIVASVKREAIDIITDSTDSFLALGFLFAGIIAAIFAFATKKNRVEACHVIKRGRIVIYGLYAGIGTVLANLFQMRSLATLPSTVVYPLTSGILVVSLWLASLLIYRETKAKPRNILAVALCVAAIVLANL